MNTEIKETIKINKTDLIDVIKESKGKFFSCTWNKKSREERTINGKVTSGKFSNKLGYIVVRTGKNEYKLVDPRTLKAARINGINYIVK